MKKIGVLVSGSGSNLQAIIDGACKGKINGEIGLVVSNKPGVFALERAARHNIPHLVIDHRLFGSAYDFSSKILEHLMEFKIDLICLAGFLRILDRVVIDPYLYRMLNIHPALLPAFGGKECMGIMFTRR